MEKYHNTKADKQMDLYAWTNRVELLLNVPTEHKGTVAAEEKILSPLHECVEKEISKVLPNKKL